MAHRLVCICNLVDEKEIEKLMLKGAVSASEIQLLTRAGTSCGKCLPQIDQMVEKHKTKKTKDPQGKLDFGL